MKKILTYSAILLLLMPQAFAQSVHSPNYGLKSPLTAEIISVDFNPENTVIVMTLTSDINNAFFCIDRNTFLTGPDGMRYRLQDLKGLPYCPRTYKFKSPGETTTFTLTFPPTGFLSWFSVVEECMGGCLSFRGVTTDPEINRRLDEAYALADRGENIAAYRIFEDLVSELDTSDLGIEGSLYSNLILLDRKMGRNESARKWYDRMMTSDTPDLGLYLENLKREGIDY